jgi:hypothetical protein
MHGALLVVTGGGKRNLSLGSLDGLDCCRYSVQTSIIETRISGLMVVVVVVVDGDGRREDQGEPSGSLGRETYR